MEAARCLRVPKPRPEKFTMTEARERRAIERHRVRC